jgi:dTDP-4-dehydrorhamnose reductase
MRIVVTGANGRLGSVLLEKLKTRGFDVYGFDVDTLDVTDFAATRSRILEIKPDIVLHPAGWTDVDGCARDPEKAILVNGFGAQNVALAAATAGAAILYISSNEVFDGTASRPYREYDVARPTNPYGYSKWVGEQAVMQHNPRHYIVRTAWLFAHGGKNFIQTILNAAAAGKPLRVVVNEIANPTYNDDLADAIIALTNTERFGIYHFVNEGACSRYHFARYALDHAGYADTSIEPISASEWSRPSMPPVYSAMTNLAGASIGIRLRPWQQAVDAFLQREQLLIHES